MTGVQTCALPIYALKDTQQELLTKGRKDKKSYPTAAIEFFFDWFDKHMNEGVDIISMMEANKDYAQDNYTTVDTPSYVMTMEQFLVVNEDADTEAQSIIGSFSGGYDSNVNTLKDVMKKLNKLKGKVSSNIKKEIEKHISNIKDTIKDLNESLDEKSSGDSALLQKMYKALTRSKNFSSVKMSKADFPEDWDGAIIKVKSKLKGESEYHKNDLDDFEIGIEVDGGITLHYTPSGNTEPVDSVATAIEMTRANESLNEATSINDMFGELSSFAAAGITKDDLNNSKKSKITTSNNKDL